MLNFGTWGEILIILVTALIVVGPKDIPKTLKMVGRWVYKVRKITQKFRGYVDDLAFDAHNEDIMNSKRDKKTDEQHRGN
jgi:sec-independent protein translocase protein TatB